MKDPFLNDELLEVIEETYFFVKRFLVDKSITIESREGAKALQSYKEKLITKLEQNRPLAREIIQFVSMLAIYKREGVFH